MAAVLAIGDTRVAELLLGIDDVVDGLVLDGDELRLGDLALLRGNLSIQELLGTEQGAQVLCTERGSLVKLRSHYEGNANRNEMSIRGEEGESCGESSRTYSRERYVKHRIGAGERRKRKKNQGGESDIGRGAEPTHRHRAHWTSVQFNPVQSSPSPDAMLPHQGKKDGHLHILHAYRNQAIAQLPQCRSARILSYNNPCFTKEFADEYLN